MRMVGFTNSTFAHHSLTDGDMVCTTISEKMWQPHKHVLAQMPVNVAALEALGGMAEKFPSLANTFVIRLLCKFLLDPCPVLAKLASEAVLTSAVNACGNKDRFLLVSRQANTTRQRKEG